MTHIQNLKKYSLFGSKGDLNKTIYTHLDQNEKDLNKTDRKLFEMISRYSVKNNGVAYLKVSTMAESLKVSTRTIKRIMKKLEQLLIIKRIHTFKRISGGFGANIIQVLPIKKGMSPCTRSKMSPCLNDEKLSEIKSEAIKSESETTSSKATKDLINTYYDRFKYQIHLFVNDKTLVSKLYGIYLAQSRQIMKFESMRQYQSHIEQLALQSITITMQATKYKRIINLAGYFNNTLSNLIDTAIYSDIYTTQPDFQKY